MFVNEHVLFVLQVRCGSCVEVCLETLDTPFFFAFQKVSKNVLYLLKFEYLVNVS